MRTSERAELIRRERITVMDSTPVLAAPLMEYVYENGLELPDMRSFIVGADSFASRRLSHDTRAIR